MDVIFWLADITKHMQNGGKEPAIERRAAVAPELTLRQTFAEAARFFALGRVPAWTLIVLPLTIVVLAALSALPPLFIGNIVDALQHRDVHGVVRALGFYVSIAILLALLGLGSSYASSIFRETLARNIQLSLFAKINRASFESLSAMTLGQVTNRILGDVRQMGTQLEYSLFPVLSNVCALLATLGIMIRLDYRLALVAFVCAFAVLLPLRIASPRVMRLQRLSSAKSDEVFGTVAEAASLTGLAAHRNAAAARHKMSHIEALTSDVFKLRVRSVILGGITGVGTSLMGMIGPSAVMALGAYLVLRGELSVGVIVAILIYQSRISAPITTLSQLQLTFAGMGVTIGRILEIANLPDESSGSKAFHPGTITFRDVSASREGRTILNRASFEIELGRHVAIIGASGAGKSSVASLILRLCERSSGRIAVGPHNLEEFVLEGLRSSIGLVSQDPFVTNASMRDNITLNQTSVEPEAFARVISVARLDEVIARLPQGLDTVLGQRGFRLSGGECQRICLARGLLQDPDILILDEALTGVDIDMERRIIEDIRDAYSTRTIIVMTHRLDSIRDFDTLIALESGSVVASGSPRELLRDPRWSRLTASWEQPAGAAT
ncbi:MAG: ABC transporter ATP-binding protein [Candidatus Aquilonibacter sp.]